jgi:hypothetical protein
MQITKSPICYGLLQTIDISDKYPQNASMETRENQQIQYREVQYFRQIWVWLLIVFIAITCWWGAITQLIYKKPFGNNPAPDSIMILIWILFGILLPILFFKCNLLVEINTEGIFIKFFPFHLSKKKILFQEITHISAITYNPIRDFGGWGIRYGTKGKAYTVSENRGVQLEFKDCKKLVIGSKNPELLAQAISVNL